LLLPLSEARSELTPRALSWLAVVELSLGHQSEAEKLARRSLLLDPEDGLARHVLRGTRLE
jgi:hypothetical protein